MARGFYGWRIVAVAFGADFIAVGFLFYSFGIFLPWVEARRLLSGEKWQYFH